MTSSMIDNNKVYWDLAMKFFNVEDGDVNKLKKDLNDPNSCLYQLAFTWNNLVHEGKVTGLRSFKTNFSTFFGLDIPTEERQFWYSHIDEITKKWNLFITGTEAHNKGDNK